MASELSNPTPDPRPTPDLRSGSVPPTVVAAEVVSPIDGVLPTSPAPAGVLTTVEPIEPSAILWKKNSAVTMLSEAPDGAALIAKATELADQLTLKDISGLFRFTEETRAAMTQVAKVMIGDARVKDIEAVERVFNNMKGMKDQLDVDMLKREFSWTRPDEWFARFMHGVAGFDYFSPIARFARGYQKIETVIAGTEQELVRVEAKSTKGIANYESQREVTLSGYRLYDVAIAAGEILYEREYAKFAADRKELEGSRDMYRVQELKNRRSALNTLDNRIMALQNARATALMNIPIIDSGIETDTTIKNTAETMRTEHIAQIRVAVGIAVQLHGSKSSIKLLNAVNDARSQLLEENLKAMGEVQQGSHALAISEANYVDVLDRALDELVKLSEEKAKMLKENRELNQAKREQHRAAELRFVDGMKAALLEAIQ